MKTKVISTARKVSKIRSFFWSAFSRIWLEHRELLSDFSFLVQIRKNMDLTYKKSKNKHLILPWNKCL